MQGVKHYVQSRGAALLMCCILTIAGLVAVGNYGMAVLGVFTLGLFSAHAYYHAMRYTKLMHEIVLLDTILKITTNTGRTIKINSLLQFGSINMLFNPPSEPAVDYRVEIGDYFYMNRYPRPAAHRELTWDQFREAVAARERGVCNVFKLSTGKTLEMWAVDRMNIFEYDGTSVVLIPE
jgi:hypothetical protein